MWKWQRLFTGGEKDSSFIIEILILVSSVAQSYPTLCDSMNHSMPGLPVVRKDFFFSFLAFLLPLGIFGPQNDLSIS